VLTATIITSKPPRVMTERQVNATLKTPTAASGGGGGSTSSSTPPVAASRAPSSTAASHGQAPQAGSSSASAAPRTLPKTASSWPLLALASILSLVIGFALTITRRFVS
jgi:hypothetical protein